MILAPFPRRLRETQGRCPLASLQANERIAPATVSQAQGYHLQLSPERITLTAHDDAGLFYGQQTLTQLRRQVDADGTAPTLEIEDWPDFLARGLMVDVSRDRVPTLASLRLLIDRLAMLKINQLQLYTEHTFAYAGHEKVWQHASPFTPDDICAIDAYCAARFIELVPNQNCFGHMERWLVHDPYLALAECPDGFTRDDLPEPFFLPGPKTLNPLDPASLALVEDLLGQLLPCFSSDTINVGCDETFDLGKGKSKAACEKNGKGRVYLDFLRKVYDVCQSHGKRMQFWGDIVLHHPDLLRELPKDAVALNWGYELDHPFEKETQTFADAGLPYMVCPSTATFVGISGRPDVAVGNAINAAEHGLRNGAQGVLNSWWGDFGHWQPWATNAPGIVMSAATSWCLASNRAMDVPLVLDTLIYEVSAKRLGNAVFELGRVRDDLPCNRDNALGWALIRDEAQLQGDQLKLPWGPTGPITADALAAARQRVENAMAGFALADPKRSDAALLIDELRVGGRMLLHSIDNLRARIDAGVSHSSALPAPVAHRLDDDLSTIIPEFEHNWHQRSRPGGLNDSIAALRRLREHYKHV